MGAASTEWLISNVIAKTDGRAKRALQKTVIAITPLAKTEEPAMTWAAILRAVVRPTSKAPLATLPSKQLAHPILA